MKPRRHPKDKPRDRLTCRAIVDAAAALVDRDGVEALSMRTLASALGVQAMSLYSHFASKEELLTALTRRTAHEMELPSNALPPRRRLTALARAYRRVGHAHPNIFPLIILRPDPLDAVLTACECGIRGFLDAGLPPREAIRAQRLLLSFVRGFTLSEIGAFRTGRRGAPGRPPGPALLAEVRGLDQDRFPVVTRLAEDVTSISPDQDFDRSVRTILDALLPTEPS